MAYIALTRSQREQLRTAARSGASDGEILKTMRAMAPSSVSDADAFAALLAGECGAPLDATRTSISEWDEFGGRDGAEKVAEPLNSYFKRWLRSNMVFSLGGELKDVVERHRAQVAARLAGGAPCDRGEIERAIQEVYRRLGWHEPRILWPSGMPTALMFLRLLRKRWRGRPEWFRRIDGKASKTLTTTQLRIRNALRELIEESFGVGTRAADVFTNLPRRERNDDVSQFVGSTLELPETYDGVVLSRTVVQSINSELNRWNLRNVTELERQLERFWPQRGPRIEMREVPPTKLGMLPGICWQPFVPAAAKSRAARELGVKLPPEVADGHELMFRLACNAWWSWFGEDTVLCCEPPLVCRRDERGRLHATDGPALMFRDGVEMYVVQGNNVPRHAVMEPSTLTLAEILNERNADLRRVLTELFGYGRYLKESGAVVVDMDVIEISRHDQSLGSMPRALMRDREGRQWLVGTDGSTRRVYYMPVPHDVATCAEAHNALAGFEENWIIASS